MCVYACLPARMPRMVMHARLSSCKYMYVSPSACIFVYPYVWLCMYALYTLLGTCKFTHACLSIHLSAWCTYVCVEHARLVMRVCMYVCTLSAFRNSYGCLSVCMVMHIAMMYEIEIAICILECICEAHIMHFAKLSAWSYLSFAMSTISQCTTRMRLLLLLAICSIEFIAIVCKHTLINALLFQLANTHIFAPACMPGCVCMYVTTYRRMHICMYM